MKGLCAAAWTLNGVIGSQLNDEQTVISVEGQDMTVSQYIEGTFGFTEASVWYSALVLVAFCITFWFVVAGEPADLPPTPSFLGCCRDLYECIHAFCEATSWGTQCSWNLRRGNTSPDSARHLQAPIISVCRFSHTPPHQEFSGRCPSLPGAERDCLPDVTVWHCRGSQGAQLPEAVSKAQPKPSPTEDKWHRATQLSRMSRIFIRGCFRGCSTSG